MNIRLRVRGSRNFALIAAVLLTLAVLARAQAVPPQAPARAAQPPAGPRDLKVASEIPGIVQEVLVKEGDQVRKGQPLLRIDDRQARLKVHIAELQVKRAEAKLESARAAEKEAKAPYDRVMAQIRVQPTSVAVEDVSMRKFTWERHQHMVLVRQADLGIAQAQLAAARRQLDKYTVRAPADGVVHTILHQPGEAVPALGTVVELQTTAQR